MFWNPLIERVQEGRYRTGRVGYKDIVVGAEYWAFSEIVWHNCPRANSLRSNHAAGPQQISANLVVTRRPDKRNVSGMAKTEEL